MEQKFVDELRARLMEEKPKYHLVVMIPARISSRYNGEEHDFGYLIDTTEEVLGETYIASSQMMFRAIADSLRVFPSGLVIPQGHADINAVSNLESHFGGSLPEIPIFEALKHTGDYCHSNGSLINPYNKEKKDKLVQIAYKNWLINSVKPHPLDVFDL